MPILKFMFTTLVTALCLNSISTNLEILRINPDIIGWMLLIFCAKLVSAAAVMVVVALWCRSAWRAWRP